MPQISLENSMLAAAHGRAGGAILVTAVSNAARAACVLRSYGLFNALETDKVGGPAYT